MTPFEPGSAADTLLPLVYGNVPMADWGADGNDDGEPWSSFAHARHLYDSGETEEAVDIWLGVASREGIESRQVLQAWYFLRQVGHQPPPNVAKLALGVVAEVPMDDVHDLLAAYGDGSARYLNHAGGASVVEPGGLVGAEEAITDWLAVGQVLANGIGPWDQPALPVLAPGHLRVMVLTPSGPHFGQGQYDALSGDTRVQAFLGAASVLLQLIAG